MCDAPSGQLRGKRRHNENSCLLHVPPEIIEHTNEVVVKIGGHKLAQLLRSVLGFGNDLRVSGLPFCEEFVHLSLAL